MRTVSRSDPGPSTRSAFAGFCFPPDVIVLAVRWYLRFALSYRDVEELLAERGVDVDHVTVASPAASNPAPRRARACPAPPARRRHCDLPVVGMEPATGRYRAPVT